MKSEQFYRFLLQSIVAKNKRRLEYNLLALRIILLLINMYDFNIKKVKGERDCFLVISFLTEIRDCVKNGRIIHRRAHFKFHLEI